MTGIPAVSSTTGDTAATAITDTQIQVCVCVSDFLQTRWPELASRWRQISVAEAQRAMPDYPSLDRLAEVYIWHNDQHSAANEAARERQYVQALKARRRAEWGAYYPAARLFMTDPVVVYDAVLRTYPRYNTYAMGLEVCARLRGRLDDAFEVVACVFYRSRGLYLVVAKFPQGMHMRPTPASLADRALEFPVSRIPPVRDAANAPSGSGEDAESKPATPFFFPPLALFASPGCG